MLAKTKKGFTLIEAIIVIALISIVASFSIPFYADILGKNETLVATDALSRTIRRAQILAKGMNEDDSWSVHLETGLIRLYRGSDYLTRNVLHDEDIELSNNITFSGNTDIHFTKFTAAPSVTGDTVINGPDNIQRTLSINSLGSLSY